MVENDVVSRDDTAYTSGSTGKPKGVLVEHGGVVNLLQGVCSLRSFTNEHRFGVTNNYVFDFYPLAVFAALAMAGGTCVLLRDSMSLLTLAEDSVDHMSIDVLMDVPSVLGVAQLPPRVHSVDSGGEALSQATIENVPAGALLYNGFGPTETTIYCLSRRVDRSDLQRRLACLGRPLPNVTCYVVDPASTATAATSAPLLQPIGVWGELWLGGVQVARGYLNRPELTAERFVPNPWPETDPSGRGVVYRTGDRVRWYARRHRQKGG